MKSVRSNIVEGYGRKKYQQEYYKHIIYALASNDETIDHLQTLYETKSLLNKETYDDLNNRLEILGKKLNLFMQKLGNDIKNDNEKKTKK